MPVEYPEFVLDWHIRARNVRVSPLNQRVPIEKRCWYDISCYFRILLPFYRLLHRLLPYVDVLVHIGIYLNHSPGSCHPSLPNFSLLLFREGWFNVGGCADVFSPEKKPSLPFSHAWHFRAKIDAIMGTKTSKMHVSDRRDWRERRDHSGNNLPSLLSEVCPGLIDCLDRLWRVNQFHLAREKRFLPDSITPAIQRF